MNDLPTIDFLTYSLAASAYVAYILPEVTEAKLGKREYICIRDKKVWEGQTKIIDLARCTKVSLWLFNFMWALASVALFLSCFPILKGIINKFNWGWCWWIINLIACATAIRGIHIWAVRIVPHKR